MLAVLVVAMTGVPLQLLWVDSANAMGLFGGGGGGGRGGGGGGGGADYGTPAQGNGPQGGNDQGSGGANVAGATRTVPEPTALYMLLVALAGGGIYFGVRRRRRAQK